MTSVSSFTSHQLFAFDKSKVPLNPVCQIENVYKERHPLSSFDHSAPDRRHLLRMPTVKGSPFCSQMPNALHPTAIKTNKLLLPLQCFTISIQFFTVPYSFVIPPLIDSATLFELLRWPWF